VVVVVAMGVGSEVVAEAVFKVEAAVSRVEAVSRVVGSRVEAASKVVVEA